MGLVGKCVGVWGEVKRDVGGDEKRFGVWGANTLPYIFPQHSHLSLHLPLRALISPHTSTHFPILILTSPLTFSKCGEVII